MDINRLRHRVTIEENQGTTNDGGGNRLPNWVPIATVWAEVRPANGSEVTIAEKRGQELTHIVTIRYRPGIDKTKHRINFKGRIFHIEYIINKEERNVELEIHCREG